MPDPKYIVRTTSDGLFQFDLTHRNGKVILTSRPFPAKSKAVAGIGILQAACSGGEATFDPRRSDNDQYYFILKENEGTVLGTSEMYSSPGVRDYAIRCVKENCPTLEIEDQAPDRKENHFALH